MSLRNGQANSIADTLTKRTSGDLNAGGVVSLWVTGSLAADSLQGGWLGNHVQVKGAEGIAESHTRKAFRSSIERS